MGIKGLGFAGLESSGKKAPKVSGALKYSKEMLHKAECSACPLNNVAGMKHPNMPATGSTKPVIYMLGEAPGKDEDAVGKQFVGKSGQLIRRRIPKAWVDKLRWNNVVRTRPPQNKTPTYLEIECCRPSVIRDIEKSKPKAIFGFGAIPLAWATGLTGISLWSGRHMPVKIGDHVCWYFSFLHPAFLLRTSGKGGADGYNSEEEFAFELQLKNAFKLVDKLPLPKVHSREHALEGITCIDSSGGDSDLRKILKLLDLASGEKVAGLDYETNAIRPYADDSKILSVSISTKAGTFAFPFRHSKVKWSSKQLSKLEDAWTEFLAESEVLKASHNLPFELEWSLVKFGRGCIENGSWGCSQSQAYILDERIGAGVQSLDGLCRQYFGISVKAINPVDRANLDKTPLDQVLLYNGVDAKYHRLLFNVQAPRIAKDDLEEQYYHNVARIAGLVQMQAKGIPVSAKRVAALDKKYTKKIEELDTELETMPAVKKFKKMYQRAFKPGSNDDVKKLFVNVLGHTDIASADAEAIKGKGPEADLLLKRRKHAKLHSTYIVPAKVGSSILFNGRFHPVVSTTTTRTWRTSSESPNSQNWPKYGEAKIARTQIRPGRGQVVVAFDFAGIQARNVAMESHDKNLVRYYWERYDIHTDWMERITRLYPRWIKEGAKKLAADKEIRKHYRQQSKNKFVFPAFFGAGAKTTSSGLEVPEDIGFKLGQQFKEEFPGIADWHKTLRAFYRKNGYITGLSGFRRRAPVAATEQINTPIQSDESVIVLDALIRLTELGDERLIPNLEIHDDLTFIWDKQDVDKLAPIVIATMLDCSYEWTRVVPLEVEMSIGLDWAALEGVGAYASDTWDGKTLALAA